MLLMINSLLRGEICFWNQRRPPKPLAMLGRKRRPQQKSYEPTLRSAQSLSQIMGHASVIQRLVDAGPEILADLGRLG